MSYSSQTKEGNWNEDEFGSYLVKSRTIPALTYLTEQSSNYINPRDMDDSKTSTKGLEIESTYDLKIKNKDGQSYALLFDHGYPSHERFKTSRNIPDKTLYHQKMSEIRKEIKMGTQYTTQSRMANALVVKKPLPNSLTSTMPIRLREGSVEEIPDSRRLFPLSNTVPKWF